MSLLRVWLTLAVKSVLVPTSVLSVRLFAVGIGEVLVPGANSCAQPLLNALRCEAAADGFVHVGAVA